MSSHWKDTGSPCYIPLYCATLALDGYPLHSNRNPCTQMMMSPLRCTTAFYKLWLHHFHLSSSAAIVIWFCLTFASVQTDLLTSCIISSFPQDQPSSTHVMASAQSCSSCPCGERAWNVMEDQTMGNPRGDKVPVKNRFSNLTKEQIGWDQQRKDIMNDHQRKALKEGSCEREWAQTSVSSREKTNTKRNLARVMTKSKSKMQTVTNGCVSWKGDELCCWRVF